MPRRGSELVKFLRDALYGNKYSNLLWVNTEEQIFRLKCIHGGNKEWTKNGCKIFEDWKNKKKRRQTDKNEFSEGRQRLLAAMNKCKLLKKFKKLSSVSVKYYQFIDRMIADSEGTTSEEMSDREASLEPSETGMDTYVENLPNDFSTVASLSAPNFKFPEEILADVVGINSNVDTPISTEYAVDLNWGADFLKNEKPQGFSSQLAPSSDISEVLNSKMNLYSDDYMQLKQEMETEFYTPENSDVQHLVNLAENIAGGGCAIGDVENIVGAPVGGDCGDAENIDGTARGDASENNSVATTNEIFPFDSVSEALQEANISEEAFPPVRLFRCGDYLIGITKVPSL